MLWCRQRSGGERNAKEDEDDDQNGERSSRLFLEGSGTLFRGKTQQVTLYSHFVFVCGGWGGGGEVVQWQEKQHSKIKKSKERKIKFINSSVFCQRRGSEGALEDGDEPLSEV